MRHVSLDRICGSYDMVKVFLYMVHVSYDMVMALKTMVNVYIDTYIVSLYMTSSTFPFSKEIYHVMVRFTMPKNTTTMSLVNLKMSWGTFTM
jgi:hypothetical protein